MSPRGHFIIVGAGYGGLGAALELHRKGFSVEVFESAQKLTTQGDVIHLSPNATRIFAKWGDVLEQNKRVAVTIPKARYYNDKGKKVLETPLPQGHGEFPELYCNRGVVQKILYDYAQSLGIPFHFGTRIEKYYEDDSSAGIYVGDKLYKADAVIAADGIHSVARTLVTGQPDNTQSSGYSIYRSWFPLHRFKDDPLTSEYATSGASTFDVWLGRDAHAMVVTNTSIDGAVIFFTRRDTNKTTSHESWSKTAKIEDMLEDLKGWDEKILAAVRQIPPGQLVDWKLMWHDQAKTWSSEKGRIAILGDAAHPHLPSSGTGAVMAFEDCATIGTVFDILGVGDVPLAFKVFQALRYERTSLTMRMGWETRHRWHRTTDEILEEELNSIKMPQPEWLTAHDPEKYAAEKTREAAECIKEGKSFVSHNTFEGYVHQEWDVNVVLEMQEKERNGVNYVVKQT